MPVFRTPQLVLFSANVPRAVEFYSALGFTEAFRVPAEGSARYQTSVSGRTRRRRDGENLGQ